MAPGRGDDFHGIAGLLLRLSSFERRLDYDLGLHGIVKIHRVLLQLRILAQLLSVRVLQIDSSRYTCIIRNANHTRQAAFACYVSENTVHTVLGL